VTPSLDEKLPQTFTDSFICCLSSYESIQISRLKNLQSLISVHGKLHSQMGSSYAGKNSQVQQIVRTFNAGCAIYDFAIHPSNEYLLALTEIGRIFVYK
jgi:hypothetical protein